MKTYRLSILFLAGSLLLAPAWSAAAAQEKPQSKQPATNSERAKRVRGPKDMADGQIKSVTCRGRAMDMTFDESYEILHLHTDNYFKVDFSAINYTPHGEMNPCKTAKGMYARVYYYHIKGHPKEGDLIAVQFRK